MFSSARKHAYSYLILLFLVNLLQPSLGATLSAELQTTKSQQDYTCSADSPCINGACCGVDGWCGYGDTYCGDGCQSNCNATAECGKNAAIPGTGCPLNVCCSEFGFCGTTTEFCEGDCQSHCTQPKPATSGSNSQQRIVGYWEAWNSQHACGTMGVGQIPVDLLTHLNIAFGYISQDYRVTSMDGLSSDVYKVVGNLKARNPALKIMIAIGGWTFSDPGQYQSVFPTMVSNEANRATFIQNLLGFLIEYGYDGVDFDWEYPGADDRGGSESDGVNYTAFLKELRAAIDASGKEYLVTFTAPTSYWYLRHFDLKAMTEYVDWINLMAYDLHGVWDSDNPIGSQVLAHTNLTEIDLALDLFWRVNVDPSTIVLGLGFYGRSFQLSDTSCWKPGCEFSGPGAKGKCTDAAGILSYREIQSIINDAGGTAYLDKEAAVRYMVYNDDNWISFDDEGTFKQKIEYANRMGLSGLMVWAIDLDDNYLAALRSISDAQYLNSTSSTFDLVDLKYIFPEELLPPAGTVPSYGLTTFGSAADAGDMSPGAGFGFLLFAGDSHVVSQLRKRDGQPDPFVFLDCPSDMDAKDTDTTFTARVICLSDDIEGCFRVAERGVEGTIVEMPDNMQQVFPEHVRQSHFPGAIARKRNPTSQVFDFKFDFNLGLMRRDSNNTSIRTDFSNVDGYWPWLVDSPGDSGTDTTDKRDLVERYYSSSNKNWKNRFYESNNNFSATLGSPIKFKEDISAPIFWQGASECLVDGKEYGEGFGAFVEGTVDAKILFGWSMVITTEFYGDFTVKEANGFMTVDGTSDLTYGISGMGTVDITKANKGNPAFSPRDTFNLQGDTVTSGQYGAFMSFSPYVSITYQMATLNGTGDEQFVSDPKVSFNGRLTSRVQTDLGDVTAYYPSPTKDQITEDFEGRADNKISSGTLNRVFEAPGAGGRIALGTYMRFGMGMEFTMPFETMEGDSRPIKRKADVGLTYDNLITFGFHPSDDSSDGTACSEYNVTTRIYQDVNDGYLMQWDVSDVELGMDTQQLLEEVCWPPYTSNSKRDLQLEGAERSLATPGASDNSSITEEAAYHSLQARGDYDPFHLQAGKGAGVPNTFFGLDDTVYKQADKMMNNNKGKIGGSCTDCVGCVDDPEEENMCCGCACMDCAYGYSDLKNCDSCDEIPSGTWPWVDYVDISISKREDAEGTSEDVQPSHDHGVSHGHHGHSHLHRRVSGKATLSEKKVTVCDDYKWWVDGDGRYPAFPRDAQNPWDGIDNGKWDSISRYWGNSSESCTSWAVFENPVADKVWVGPSLLNPLGSMERAQYQTEHVFEGQLIGDFFTYWLDQGKASAQAAKTSTAKISCSDIKDLFTTSSSTFPWKIGNNKVPFIEQMLYQLGNIGHLDRLTIFMGRPNLRKGILFSGKSNDMDVFKRMTADQQVLSAKELGMVFNYMNEPVVWSKFCATYEAIYDLLGQWQTYYNNNPNAPLPQGLNLPDLQDEWKTYINTALDQIVSNGKSTFNQMHTWS
ncbi:hypothetical protein N7522_006472 [Penicillium canescens]|nr:hypothetical protein N7522_006472 [Penicillium canescens]